MLKSTIFVKLKPTDPLQIMIVAMLSEENPPSVVSLDILATLTFTSRTWSPDKNSIVVLEIKYNSGSCAHSDNVQQLIELEGQDEHEAAVGVTQYTFSVEQREGVLMEVLPRKQ